jgi:DNA-binding SARP family transcriptional activator
METIQLPKEIALKAFDYALQVADESFCKEAVSILDKYNGIPAKPLRFKMLGNFRVYKGSEELQRKKFKRTKAWRLLSFLAHRFPHKSTHEMLIDIFWNGMDKAAGKRNIYTTLCSLCSTLEPDKPRNSKSSYICHKDGMIWLEPSLVDERDIDEFDRLNKQGNTELAAGRIQSAIEFFMKANELHRGDYLENEFYTDWPIGVRTLYSEKSISVQEAISTTLLDNDRVMEAIFFLIEAFQKNPLSENLCRVLMKAYHQVGMLDKVNKCFLTYRDTLRSELGIEPDPHLFNTFIQYSSAC